MATSNCSKIICLCACGCGGKVGEVGRNFIRGHAPKHLPCNLESRFFPFIVKHSGHNGCWVWTGEKTAHGYGSLRLGGSKRVSAHRTSYKYFYGEIPTGLYVCHSCDNPACVNPAHLWLGTPKENAMDMSRKGRQAFQINPKRAARGERASKAKLTEPDVIAIKSLLGSGAFTLKAIGNLYGVSATAIRYIKSGKNWAHVA